jgi:hypothetical protein
MNEPSGFPRPLAPARDVISKIDPGNIDPRRAREEIGGPREADVQLVNESIKVMEVVRP